MARPVDIPREGDRIAKLLARAGVASRREVERMIAEGRVAQAGVAVDTPALLLTTLADITVDGQPVAPPEPARLFLYHKPPGLLVTERDPRGRPTIYDRLPEGLPRVVPVGRLDLNTEGLLLLTTDGGLKRQLELPATGVERSYRARAYGPVGQGDLEALIEGIEIDGFRYGPIDANLERRTGANSWIELTLAEGKNREVRRVLEHLGLEVSRLIRTRYGPFVLGDLPPGAVGEVRQADLAAFRQTLGNRKAWPERVAVSAPSATRGHPRNPPRHGEGDRRPQAGGGGGPVPRTAAGQGRMARPGPVPGESRGPVAPVAGRRAKPAADTGGRKRAAPTPTAPRPDPGVRRGGNGEARTQGDPPSSEALPARPARIQRKPGWAKPKPKPGARPPRKR